MSHPAGESASRGSTQSTAPVAGVHRAELSSAGEPTVGRLVADASTHLSTLLRSEIALAKSELKISALAGGIGAAMLTVAAFLLLLAIVMASIAAAYALDYIVPTWAAFLIVFGVYVLLALVIALIGIKRLKKVSAPERTIETTKETVATLRNR